MNCCNDQGICTRGKDCPARKDKFPQITMEDDDQWLTLDEFVGVVKTMLDGVGVLAIIVAIGFWSAR